MNLELYPHQQEALEKMKNGCILCGGVGSGKSRTALSYYFTKVADGSLCINGKGKFEEPKKPIPLYIITTARKRDTKEWEDEFTPFLLSTDADISIKHIKVIVDSWNNIKKYAQVKDAFFIFDEDRVCGSGAWSKTFIKISKMNKWIILSATPGDNWSDYIPVFIANGFYKNKTEFYAMHCVFNRYTDYPKIDKYVGTKRLERCRDAILVKMDFERPTVSHEEQVLVQYDMAKYKVVMKDRWDPYDNCPIENVSKLCYLLRRVINSDPSRIKAVKEVISYYDRCIIFYNFDYELEILQKIGKEVGYKTAEWNGHVHNKIPRTKKWLYLVQYTAGAEGWNCIETNVIIFYSLNYSYKTMVQSAGRINRLNTPYKDLYFYYVRSTAPIDSAIRMALKRKKKFNEKKFIEG